MTKAARVLNSVRQTDQGKEKRVLTEKEEGEREREREREGEKYCVYVKEKKVYGGIPFATKCLRTSNILLL